mgnify:CR=1 FL=1|jgi:hypothetical protein
MLHLSQTLIWLQTYMVAGTLCAEVSFDRADCPNVAQVIRNRAKAGCRFKGACFPKTAFLVATQRGQFARPSRCTKLRKFHITIARRLLTGRALAAHRRVKDPKVVFFLNLKRYKELRKRWRKARLVAYQHRRISPRTKKPYGHVYMFLREHLR